MIIRGLKALFVLFLLAAPGAAFASDPSPLVGRVSYIDGTVSFHSADQTQWSYATLNYPVTGGVSFWTEPQSRTELEIGAAQLRLDSSTAVDVLQLDPTTTQIQIDQGSVNYYVTEIIPGQTVEFETPHGAVAITKPGTYHIDAGDATNPTVVAALEGEARLIGVQSYLDITSGEEATAIGTPLSYTMAPAVPNDFDNWALARDKREQTQQTVRYVSPQTTGYQDLDQYGQWQPSPQYGQVWYPQSVPADWTPYHDGHWAYLEPWGWTWIDNQPWGFAPFHYGRWANVNNRWGWVPGTLQPRPVYAPALVAFTGGVPIAPGIGVTIAIGGPDLSIGWIPLAPNEPYYPPYGASRDYWHNLNAGAVNRTVINNYNPNFTHVTVNNYANHQAATFVPTGSFTNARPVAATSIRPDAASFQNAAVSNNLNAYKPSAYARVATAAPVRTASATPQTAPGPSENVQHNEATEIHHEAPASLSTAGKVEGQTKLETKPEQAPAPPTATRAPGPTIRPVAREAEATAPVKESESRPAEMPHVEAKTTEAARDPLHPHAGATPGTAPGPTIDSEAASGPRAVRQTLVAQSAHEAEVAAKPPARARARTPAPVSTPAPAARTEAAPVARPQAVAYRPAEVEHPAQTAPLKATTAGWHRENPAPAAAQVTKPAAKSAFKDDKDKDKDKDKAAH